MRVPIPNYLEEFGQEEKNYYLHGNPGLFWSLFKDLNTRKDVLDISRDLGVSDRLIYYYISGGKAPPIKSLLKLIKKYKKKGAYDNIYKNFNGVSTWGHSPVSLPKHYTSDLAYLSGIILGDGHVSKRTEISICTDSEEFANDVILPIIVRLFGYKPASVHYDNYLLLVIMAKPVHFLFSRVIGMPSGKKKGKISIPKFIFMNRGFKVNFIRGLFDSDGGVTCSKKYSILISSSTLPFIIEVKSLLSELGVHLGGPYRSGSGKGNEIRTFKAGEIIKFQRLIGSRHPKKAERLNASVAQLAERSPRMLSNFSRKR